VLFHPYIPSDAIPEIIEVLNSRWIGQGPRVDEFESQFSLQIAQSYPSLAVGSGTDALHLAYLLAGIQPGDEVLTPLFTCTATNLPLLYIGAKPVFLDVNPRTMNISTAAIKESITEKTKAIVTVDYGGLPCDYDEIMLIAKEYGLKVIDDAAHSIGATYKNMKIGSIADFSTFSFQAIKHITTGDGGMLTIKDESLLSLAKRLRWFGINREAKEKGIWANDINEVGFKYQLTDIGAALGLAGLKNFGKVLEHRQLLLQTYMKELSGVPGLYNVGSEDMVDRTHAAWLHTVLVENRSDLQKKLRTRNIESAPVHYRNDMYAIFGGRKKIFSQMDAIEDKYLVLPIHMKLTQERVYEICEVIKEGW
jgi:dTDP-4-amino-4,6-dideoxygalactose transaminase